MKWTVGIITGGGFDDRISSIIESVKKQIPEHQIIIVGPSDIPDVEVYGQELDRQRQNWITRKKNIVTENAKYDNIIYLHDYIVLGDDFYDGFVRFGEDWNICMTKIYNIDGSRYHDWILLDNDQEPLRSSGIQYLERKLPYNVNLTKWQYISGAYWCAKKDVMTKYPLNDELTWGGQTKETAEDIEWSMRVRQEYEFSMNPESSVKLIKTGKHSPFSDVRPEIVEKIIPLYNQFARF